jgi:uncharacterized tellurite resistance protein B-like protein
MDASTKVEILRAACCVGGADGKTTEEELKLLLKLAKEIGVGQASLTAMIERAETDPEFHRQQFGILKAEPTQTLAILFQIAMADGKVDESETGVLKNLADNLEVPGEIFEQVKLAACKAVE